LAHLYLPYRIQRKQIVLTLHKQKQLLLLQNPHLQEKQQLSQRWQPVVEMMFPIEFL
jgi:hypothetical protein